jgi:hypothetical protein
MKLNQWICNYTNNVFKTALNPDSGREYVKNLEECERCKILSPSRDVPLVFHQFSFELNNKHKILAMRHGGNKILTFKVEVPMEIRVREPSQIKCEFSSVIRQIFETGIEWGDFIFIFSVLTKQMHLAQMSSVPQIWLTRQKNNTVCIYGIFMGATVLTNFQERVG